MHEILRIIRENSVSATVIGLMLFVMCTILAFSHVGFGPDDYMIQRLTSKAARLDYDRLEFAGERVVLDEGNIMGVQKLEKELLITQFNIYQFLLYHKRAPLYFPYIESVLADHDVPNDFKYLTLAESGLRTDAVSHAGAAGIWQFIPETARRYGLTVNEFIDERYHFKKSSIAAAKYLAYIHDLLARNGYEDGSWTLTAAAYNRGENGLLSDLESQPTANGYYDLVLNSETGQYLYRIIAIKYLMLAREGIFGKRLLDRTFSLPTTKTMTITGPILDLRVWSLESGVDYGELRQLNPWIRSHVLPEGEWEVELLK